MRLLKPVGRMLWHMQRSFAALVRLNNNALSFLRLRISPGLKSEPSKPHNKNVFIIICKEISTILFDGFLASAANEGPVRNPI